MAIIAGAFKGVPKAGIGAFGLIKKYWYWIILIIIILPSIINSIQIAVETNNPSYPFFDLATRIFSADQALEKDVEMLRTNPDGWINMVKPESGLWMNFKYYWLFFWRGIYSIISNVWLIFFPLVLIYKIIHSTGNRSLPASNLAKATLWFVIYLFIINAVILVHGLTIGNSLIKVPENMDTFLAYYYVFLEMIPFHGLWGLILYLRDFAMGKV